MLDLEADLEAVLQRHGVPIKNLDISGALEELIAVVEEVLEDLENPLDDEDEDDD